MKTLKELTKRFEELHPATREDHFLIFGLEKEIKRRLIKNEL